MKLAMKIYIGASVILLAVASIGLWHWYWESSMWRHQQPVERDDIKEVKEEPEIVVCFPWADDNAKKGYPIHWGPEPNIQTRDYRKLPEPFGHGSSTLFNWIKENQANDAKNK